MRRPPALSRGRRLGAAVAASLLLAAMSAGCATTARAGPQPSDPEPGDAVVKLVGLDFAPRTVEVPVGRRVHWEWTDSVVHNVVSRDFASSKQQDGGSHIVRFDRAGSYPYRCTLHAGMEGTVVVNP